MEFRQPCANAYLGTFSTRANCVFHRRFRAGAGINSRSPYWTVCHRAIKTVMLFRIMQASLDMSVEACLRLRSALETAQLILEIALFPIPFRPMAVLGSYCS